MSDLSAALLTIGLIAAFAIPGLYWIFFKMDAGHPAQEPRANLPNSISKSDIDRIERELSIKLPDGYRSFISSERDGEDIDETTVISDAHSIVSATKEYRNGFSGLDPWPISWIYVGDEADACPYALDCDSGQLLRLDKGNRKREPLEKFLTFDDFLTKRRQNN